jgi:hypothetical protein
MPGSLEICSTSRAFSTRTPTGLALNLLLQLCQLSYSEVQEAKIGSKPEQFNKESWTVLNIRALGQTYTQSCGRNSTPANVSKSSGL